jgi:hypothetical protein
MAFLPCVIHTFPYITSFLDRGRVLDRLHDLVIARTTAQVSGYGLFDLAPGRFGFLFQ